MTPFKDFTKDHVPAFVRTVRRGMGLKQSEFAALVGTTRASVANAESGRNMPRADVMVRIVGHALVQQQQQKRKAA